MLALALCGGAGVGVAWLLREQGLRWTWALAGFPVGVLVSGVTPVLALGVWAASALACRVPESAEQIAGIAGSRAAWVTTQQTEQRALMNGPSGRGSRRRGYGFELHPVHIKRLRTGQAAVITPGQAQPPTITRINHPRSAHR
jgi:hypothetical protein